MLALLGKKLGQTRVYDKSGVLIPVTVVLAGPNRVVQVKTIETDGYNAVQFGFDDQKKETRLSKGLQGHFKKNNVQTTKRLKEFRDFSKEVKVGDVVGPDLFAVGDYVDAIGLTGFVALISP
jgi:large subunit ribosomal protein L3